MMDRGTEHAVALGTILLTPEQIAPRLGYKGAKGVRKVIARARAGELPCHRPNSRTYRFHWPTVIAQITGQLHRKITSQGGLERSQRTPHKPLEAGSTPAPATKKRRPQTTTP